MDTSFVRPHDPRGRHSKLEQLVALALATDEDPLVLAQSAGVSPMAFIRALPAEHLTKFIPGGVAHLSPQDILLKLASNHALDTAVQGLMDEAIDAKTRVILARDLMNRGSLVGAKHAPPATRVELSDDSLAKLVELERMFTNQGLAPDTMPAELEVFHRVTKGGGGVEDGRQQAEAWEGPVLPEVKSLDFDFE